MPKEGRIELEQSRIDSAVSELRAQAREARSIAKRLVKQGKSRGGTQEEMTRAEEAVIEVAYSLSEMISATADYLAAARDDFTELDQAHAEVQ